MEMSQTRQQQPVLFAGTVRDPGSWSVGDAVTIGTGVIAISTWIFRRVILKFCRYCWDWGKLPTNVANMVGKMRTLECMVSITAQRSRAMLDTVTFPVWESDMNGNCVWCNRYMLRRLGRQFSELAGNNWRTIIHVDDFDDVVDAWEKAIRDRRDFEHSYHWVGADSRLIPVAVRTQRLFCSDGTVEGYIAFVTDGKWPTDEPTP